MKMVKPCANLKAWRRDYLPCYYDEPEVPAIGKVESRETLLPASSAAIKGQQLRSNLKLK